MTAKSLTGSRSRIVSVLAFVAAIAGVSGWWLQSRHFETTDDAQVEGHLHAISARTTGTVMRIDPNVQNNHFVEAGTLLLELDPLSSTVGSEAWNSRDLKSRPH